MPSLRSEGLAISQDLPDTGVCHIHSIVDIDIAPPLWWRGVGEVQREEDDNGRDEKTSVKRCGCDVVILQPPASPAALDVVVEDNTDNTPCVMLALWRSQ
jgi:hypothetical protein